MNDVDKDWSTKESTASVAISAYVRNTACKYIPT